MKQRRLNKLFQPFTTRSEEIIENRFYCPYKRIIFECNYYHQEIIYLVIFGTMGLRRHVSNLFNSPPRQH